MRNRKSFRNSRAQYPLGTESSSPSGHNQKPVTTNFTGCKPDEIYADFVFIDDGKYLIKCKNFRNRVEAISSLLRQRYHVNRKDIRLYQ